MAYSVWLFRSIHMPKAISHMPMLSRLHPAILPIDCTPDFRHLVALLHHSRPIQRLVHADVAICRVMMGVEGKQRPMAGVLIALAVTIKLVENIRHIVRDLVGRFYLSHKKSRRKRQLGLAPYVGAAGLRFIFQRTASTLGVYPGANEKSQGDYRASDP